MPNKSLNQRYKESGSTLNFKEWVRQDLNDSVWATAKRIDSGFSNADGSNDAGDNYKPTLNNTTILGINKVAFYGVGSVIVLLISVGVYRAFKS